MDENCTIYRMADFFGKKWTLLILLELYKGIKDYKRFNQIKRGIKGITPKMLSLRLSELENRGLVKKKINSDKVPVESRYYLTESGKDFIRIIKDIKAWVLKWQIDNELCKGLDCKDCEL
ncbi:transcriptional regulator [Candidatus Woesearchaeota archaeon]|nr:transcriptional regulator [Candidatus Woesearchaeota archaeon]